MQQGNPKPVRCGSINCDQIQSIDAADEIDLEGIYFVLELIRLKIRRMHLQACWGYMFLCRHIECASPIAASLVNAYVILSCFDRHDAVRQHRRTVASQIRSDLIYAPLVISLSQLKHMQPVRGFKGSLD